MAIPECKMGAINPNILACQWKGDCEGMIHGFPKHRPSGTKLPYAGSSAMTA